MAGSCGCYFHPHNSHSPQFLPQVDLNAHATILSSTSRTVLTQTFTNPSKNGPIKELSYTFPLYNDVSVVGFTCHVGGRVLQGQVKEKEKADLEYRKAVSHDQKAGIFDHSSSAPDIFVIRLGNIDAGGQVVVKLTYIEELKQDAQTDGVRYTLPNVIAPRYGPQKPDEQISHSVLPTVRRGVSITVDVAVNKGSAIRGVDSPSHPIKVLLGRTSISPESVFEPHQASASLHLAPNNAFLDRDFVVKVNADGQDKPQAFLESHPTMPNQRALMTTLVPKFNLPTNNPEIVFIVDRSGSMEDKIPTLRAALRVFLKSLPLGVHFNICSFGSRHEFLWPRSVPYEEVSLEAALQQADTLAANMGGTEMHRPVEETIKNRRGDKDLEVLMLTDGEIWDQARLFSIVMNASSKNKIRFFTLGIGDAVSHSLIEGIAKAGNGFSQSVLNYEELDRKVVRMLKGALMPHIDDYTLEVEYNAPTETDSEFELVEPDSETASDSSTVAVATDKTVSQEPTPQEPISLYSSDCESEDHNNLIGPVPDSELPSIPPPDHLQAPTQISNLYPFIRLSAYILLGRQSSDNIPQALTFRASSKYGPLILRIPIQDVGKGEVIHQLACRKAITELEKGCGWLEKQTKNMRQSERRRLVARECQRLGTQFQVTGKHCSFVALEKALSQYQSEEVAEPKFSVVDQVPAEYLSSRDQRHCCDHTGGSQPQRSSMRLFAASGPYRPPMAQFCSAGGPQLFGGGTPQIMATPISGVRSARAFGDRGGGRGGGVTRESACRGRSTSRLFGGADDASSNNETRASSNKVHGVIDLQSIHGFWKWSPNLLKIIEVNENLVKDKITRELQRTTNKNGNDLIGELFANDDNATLLATMLAIAFLETKCAESKETWELVQAKAESWIQSRRQINTYGIFIDKCRTAINALF